MALGILMPTAFLAVWSNDISCDKIEQDLYEKNNYWWCYRVGEHSCSAVVQAQGTMTYLSSLSQSSTGSDPVGSDSWLAAIVWNGNNPGGYSLDSIQLGMADASGFPSNFTVMLYTACWRSSYSREQPRHAGRLLESNHRRHLYLYHGFKHDIVAKHQLFYCAHRRNNGCQWRL